MQATSNLPSDFDPATYLEINPDVLVAGMTAERHYLTHGMREGRSYRRRQPLSAAPEGSNHFTSAPPSDQTIIDVFKGEWSSIVPGFAASTGTADLFEDPRMRWMNEVFNVSGRTVIELGPLECGHSYMVSRMGAKSITAIEGNERAYLKCLCIKDLFRIANLRLLHGDFMRYFEVNPATFDIAIASGVLYHMASPLELLDHLTRVSDRIYLWTHFYDSAVIEVREDRHLYIPQELTHSGRVYAGAHKAYPERAIDWSGFSGGPDHYAVWLSRDSLTDYFHWAGFDLQFAFEMVDHPNGPSLALCATRKPAL